MAKKKQNNLPQIKQPIDNKAVEIKKETTQNNFALSQPLAYGVLILATFLAFAGGFSNDFVGDWDDSTYVSKNSLINNPTFGNLFTLLKSEIALNYHPVTMFSLWLNSLLFGKGATSFIIINFLIHLFNTLLAFDFTKKLTRNGTSDAILLSLLVALFWGIHPMHVESVTWISERKDLLYGMFFFLSCIQYVSYLETENRKYYFLSLLFFVLSCLSKGMAVSLPIVLFLIDFWFNKKVIDTKNIIQKIPFLLIALGFGLLAIHVQSGGTLGGFLQKFNQAAAVNKNPFSISQKIGFGFYGFLIYLIKFFIPYNQHNFYDYPKTDNINALQYITAPIWAFIILLGAFLMRNKNKAIFWGIFFFFISIALVLQFISVGGAILAERYTYIPYFGLSFLVFYNLLEQYKIKQTSVAIISGIVALSFIYLTYTQTRTYKNIETLFLESYKYEPTSPTVNEFLAQYYGDHGNIEAVIKHGEITYNAGLLNYNLASYLGNAYVLKGDYEKAENMFNKAIESSPDYAKSTKYYNRAVMFQYSQRHDKAIDDFSKAIEIGKKNEFNVNNYYKNRGFSYLQIKDFEAAKQDFTTCINLKISLDTAYNNRAIARYNLGDKNGAIEDLNASIKINPNYQEGKNNLEKLLQVK